MPLSLDFAFFYRYEGGARGIQVPVSLRAGRLSVDLLASVDTGSAFCIFERRYADDLGFSVGSGRFQRFMTAAGSFGTFEREIEIRTFDLEFTSIVYFAEDRGFEKNVLGRSGWLDRLRVGLVDYDRTILLSSY